MSIAELGQYNGRLQLIGALRTDVPEPGDYSFLSDLFERIPDQVEHQGRLTRYVGYEGPRAGSRQPYFMGLEVEAVERIPEGMMAWVLDDGRFTVLEPVDGKNVVTWQSDLAWMWCNVSGSRKSCAITGEFSTVVPKAWPSADAAAPVPFSAVCNCFVRLDEAGPDDEVRLVDYDPKWPQQYDDFSRWLTDYIGKGVVLGVHHIGSTAIPQMPAKPIVDVLVEIPSFAKAKPRVLPAMNMEQWEYWFYKGKLTFIKRDGLNGRRTHHVHMMPRGKKLAAHLAFRDHMRSHAEDALRYAALKRELADTHKTDRESYTDAKAAFIDEIVRKAGGPQ